MSYILKINDISERTGLAKNTPESSINHIISITENIFIKPLLGEDFFKDIVNSILDNIHNNTPVSQEYLTLLNGDTYFSGLKTYFSWRCYAKYIKDSRSVNTPIGVKQISDKISNNSTATILEDKIKETESYCAHYEKEILDYLNKNLNLYPLYTPKKESKNVRQNKSFYILGGDNNDLSDIFPNEGYNNYRNFYCL